MRRLCMRRGRGEGGKVHEETLKRWRGEVGREIGQKIINICQKFQMRD